MERVPAGRERLSNRWYCSDSFLLKIAFLTHEPFYPPSGGGSAEAIYLVQELVRRTHQVDLFCPAFAHTSEAEQKFGIRIHPFKAWQMGRYTRFRNLKYLLYPFFLQRLVAAKARETSFDLVLSQHAIAAVAAGRLGVQLHLPVIMNFLDYLTGFMEAWPAYIAPPPALKQLKRFELSLPLRYQAAGLMTVSDTLADLFAGTGYPRDRIRPIYYGFDADLFPFRAPAQRQAERPIIVMHGSLDHHHLRDIALESICRVTERRPDALFRIVGHRTAALTQLLARASQRCPKANIETTGFIPYGEISRYLSETTVGIVPYEESTGTHCAFVAKIVEYLAVGLPVVSTPLQSALRYFRDEPMIRFSKFDGIQFGDDILGWIQEPRGKWRDRAQAASARVRSELDWRVISQNAAQFIEEREARRRLHGSHVVPPNHQK